MDFASNTANFCNIFFRYLIYQSSFRFTAKLSRKTYCTAQGTQLNYVWALCATYVANSVPYNIADYVAAWMEGAFGEQWMHVYVWLSPSAAHLKLSKHC